MINFSFIPFLLLTGRSEKIQRWFLNLQFIKIWGSITIFWFSHPFPFALYTVSYSMRHAQSAPDFAFPLSAKSFSIYKMLMFPMVCSCIFLIECGERNSRIFMNPNVNSILSVVVINVGSTKGVATILFSTITLHLVNQRDSCFMHPCIEGLSNFLQKSFHRLYSKFGKLQIIFGDYYYSFLSRSIFIILFYYLMWSCWFLVWLMVWWTWVGYAALEYGAKCLPTFMFYLKWFLKMEILIGHISFAHKFQYFTKALDFGHLIGRILRHIDDLIYMIFSIFYNPIWNMW